MIERVDSTGALLGPEIAVAQSEQLGLSELAFDRNGNLYVVWVEGFGGVGARLRSRRRAARPARDDRRSVRGTASVPPASPIAATS